MVLESITVALKEEGIEEIPAMGETFDPNLHQAVQTVPLLKKPQQIPLLKFYKRVQITRSCVTTSMVIVAQ